MTLAPESEGIDLYGAGDGFATAGSEEREQVSGSDLIDAPLCNGEFISSEAVDQMLVLTDVSDKEDIHRTYERIDGIAAFFEACADPWGISFPTAYRHITARIIQAIETAKLKIGSGAKTLS